MYIMKKIILAVASVLTVGLFASCQREISGELDMHSVDTTNRTFYYTVSGSISETQSVVEYAAKATASAAETKSADKSIVTTYEFGGENPTKISLTYREDKNNNIVTYTYTFPASVKKVVTKRTPVGGTTSTGTAITVSDTTVTSISVYKIDGKYYVDSADGARLQIKDFNPTATTIDFSKLNDTTSGTKTTYNTNGFTVPFTRNSETGAVETYNDKEVTVTEGWKYSLTLTRK